MILSKFSGIDKYLRKNLGESTVWFSAPVNFNDPYDSNIQMDTTLDDKDITAELEFCRNLIYEEAIRTGDYSSEPTKREIELEEFFHGILSDRGADGRPDAGQQLLVRLLVAMENRRNSIGISCFSRDSLGELMWAHYADKHRGLCLEVDSNLDPFCFRQVHSINYVSTRPMLKILAHLKTNLIEHYCTKSMTWAYECEVRAFQHSSGAHAMDPICLKKVIFGIATPPEDVADICQLVREKYGEHVTLSKLIHSRQGGLCEQPVDA